MTTLPRLTVLFATTLAVAASCATKSTPGPAPFPPPAAGAFAVTLTPVPLAGLPALQSYVLGEAGGKWLLLGGRKDGLHKRRPFEAFLAADNNTTAYVVDPVASTVWSQSVTSLAPSLASQLQSTNMEFVQRDDTLYIIGGYGYDAEAGDHMTHPYLTAIDVPAAIDAIIAGDPLAPHVRQLADERMAVTGGYLGEQDDVFYLAGGQRFTGRYNPMGPSHGPGFTQAYTDEIRRFGISDDGTTLTITGYAAWHDAAALHRRDYNLVPQIFPDGRHGFTMFSGVFQQDRDVPWLTAVDFDAEGYQLVPGFEQLLSHYHSAHAPLHDAQRGEMHTLFFGGMAQFFYDADGTLTEDSAVPFVNTISMVTRGADGSMREFVIGEMPALLGASAEFVPNPDLAGTARGIIAVPALPLPPAGLELGYIVGGIESSAPNVFFSDVVDASIASSRLFRVTLTSAP
ncbi:MAG: T9SS C-terminal target domain-containing protein [Myxococcales bacterium]|nr:T9SS C-terminal target domain-containing protein [Myxococcales bacterium]